MNEMLHRTVRTNGIDMHIAEIGEGPPVILCHGFPELWYSYRDQLPALAAGGYRAIAPDLRGYGRTDCPPDVNDYDILQLTGDLTSLLDELGEEQAVFVGHDWGSIVVWNMATIAPERVKAVVGMSVPFVRRPPAPPVKILENALGDNFFYIVYFQEVGTADKELDSDPRRFLRAFIWTASGDAPRGSYRGGKKGESGLIDTLSEPEQMPQWITEEELDYYVTEFERTGFTGGLNWYRNLDRNWELTEKYADRKIDIAALFITGERDPVQSFMPSQGMDEWVPGLQAKIVIPEAGHWVQQERPEEVNRVLLDFLSGL